MQPSASSVITSVEHEGETKAYEQQNRPLTLQKICVGILALMSENLIPSASTGEQKVFYYKMKRNCHRFFAESASGDDKSKIAEEVVDVPVVNADDSEGAEICGGSIGARHWQDR